MKKISLLILTIGLLGGLTLSTSSCTREYTCQCTMTYSGQPGLPESTIHNYQIKDTKKNAKEMCENNSAVYQEGTITTREDCELW